MSRRRLNHARLGSLAAAAAMLGGCTNLHQVEDEQVFRSAQPSTANLAGWIDEHDLKTVIYLRGSPTDSPNYQATHRATVAAGIDFVQVPLTARRYPTRNELLVLWEALETARYPILMHCHGGADRSGLASALHVLRRSGNPHEALEQFALAPYLHTGLKGAWHLPEVLRWYAPWRDRMRFPDWVRLHYDPDAPGSGGHGL